VPQRSNLLEPGDMPELIPSGRVLNHRGISIANAIVNLWSSDAVGNYDLVGYNYTGYVVTDEAGGYELTWLLLPARREAHPHEGAGRHVHPDARCTGVGTWAGWYRTGGGGR
jgi:protocatechuate 3,4-dioxygenase beta subunit